MINLQLAIYEGDAQSLYFYSLSSLLEYLEELKMFDCVWLAADNNDNGEIMVTENLDKILIAIAHDHWDICEKDSVFFMQEYPSYEAAYEVALSMREPNPKWRE